MSRKLNDRQIEHMDLLLRRVRAAMTERDGVKADIKDVGDAFDGDLYQRERFTVPTYERFVAWCETAFAVTAPIGDSRSLGGGLFLINLANSEITEEDIFDKAVDDFQGKYLFFTWVGASSARITWIELKPRTDRSSLPTFEAHRGDLIFYGIYYSFEGSLFLFGHKLISPMSRSLFLTRAEGDRPRDLLGVVAGASYDKTVFASSCYAHALDQSDEISSFETQLGFKPLEEIFMLYPHVRPVFEKYGHLQMDLPRLSGD